MKLMKSLLICCLIFSCSSFSSEPKPLKINPSHSILKSDKEIELEQDFASQPIFKSKIKELEDERAELQYTSPYHVNVQRDKVQDTQRMAQIEKKLKRYYFLQKLADQPKISRQNFNQKHAHTTLHHVLQKR